MDISTSNGNGTHAEEPISPDKLVGYLRDTIPNVIGGSESDLSNTLAIDENMVLLKKYASR